MQQLVFSSDNRKQKIVFSALLAIFVFVLYGNTINHSYNLDDQLVTQNHRLTSKGVSAIPEIFTSPYYEDEQGYSYEYRPVVLTSFAIENSLFGENPKVSHLINLLLYAATVTLVFILFTSIFPQLNLLLPLLIALIFAAHPMHTEAVANIKNRDEVLSLMGGLLSMYFAVKYVKLSKLKFLPFVIIFFLFGMLSKTSILPLTLLTPLVIIFFLKPSFNQFALITFSLLVVTFFIAPLNFLSQRIYLVLLVSIILSLFYLYFNTQYYNVFKDVFLRMKKYAIKPMSLNFISEKMRDNVISEPDISNKFIYPNKEINIGSMVLILLSSLVFLVLGVLEINAIFSFLSILPLTFLYWKGNKELRSIGLFLLLLYLSILGVRFNLNTVPYILVLLLLLNFFPRKNTKVNYFISIAYILYFIVFVDFNSGFTSFLIPTAFLFLSYRNGFKKYNWGLYTVYFLFLILKVVDLFLEMDSFGLNEVSYRRIFVPFSVLLVGYAVFKYRKPILVLRGILITSLPILLIVNILLSGNYDTPDYIPNNTTSTELNDNIKTEREIIDDQRLILKISPFGFFTTDRPINFVEMPLSYRAPLDVKVGTSFYILGEYLKKIFVPYEMGYYYGYSYIVPVGLGNPQALLSLLVHLSLLLIILVLLFKRKYLIICFGIIFYMSCISVFSNFLYPVVGMMADRFTYVASLGYSISIAYLILLVFKVNLNNKGGIQLSSKLILTVVILLGAYSYKTIARNALWENPMKLMMHDINHLDKSAQAHNLLANFSMREYANSTNPQLQLKYLNIGAKHFTRACEIYPEFFNARFDLGRVQVIKGNDKEAVEAFKKVLEIDSTFTNAMVYIANIYEDNGMFKEAIPYYEMTIRHANKSNLDFYNMLAYTWFRLGDYSKAIEVGERTLVEHPNSFDPLSNIGKTYLHIGDTATAVNYFDQAFKVRQDPNIAYILSKYYRDHEDIKKANYYNSFTGTNQ